MSDRDLVLESEVLEVGDQHMPGVRIPPDQIRIPSLTNVERMVVVLPYRL